MSGNIIASDDTISFKSSGVIKNGLKLNIIKKTLKKIERKMSNLIK